MLGRRIAKSVLLILASIAVVAVSRPAFADEPPLPTEGLQLELGAFIGVHSFANNLELGVADDPGVVPHPKLGAIGGLRLAGVMLPWFSLEGEIGLIPSADSIHDYSIYLLSYKLHALVHLMPGRFRPFVLAGIGAMQVVKAQANPGYTEIAPDTDFDFHAGAGIKYAITRDIDARFDARVVFLPNTGHNSFSADLEFLAGASYRFGGSGPPAPPPPAPPPLVKDTDRDDIPDNVDKCPTEPEDKDGFQDDDGCPDPDNDADGIPDAQDKCPNEAEDKDGFQDDDGCPDPDNDADGVLDAQDKCPTEKETMNGYQDDDGCPDEVPAAVKKFTGVIKGITFKVNSADIQKSSFAVLTGAVKVMKDFPDLRIEISGHTSSEGDAAKNTKLSQARADSVKAYLVSAGIAGERVTAVGYGSDKPIADNKTGKGRAQNRRIEFRLITGDDAKAGASGTGGGAVLEGKSSSAIPTTAPGAKPAPPKGPPAGEPMPTQ